MIKGRFTRIYWKAGRLIFAKEGAVGNCSPTQVRMTIPAIAGMTRDREGNRRSVGVSVSVVSEDY